MLMGFCPGTAAYKLWPDQRKRAPDNPSPQLMIDRVAIFVSLASEMVKLSLLTFPAIGLPDFTKGGIDSWPEINSPACFNRTTAQEPISCPWDYFNRKLNIAFPQPHPYQVGEDTSVTERRGIRKFFDMVFAKEAFTVSKRNPFDPNEPHSFVLSHNDLDLQNIHLEDDNTVCGVLDWDGTYALPRCLGFASLPKFLRKDWLRDYEPDTEWYKITGADRYIRAYVSALKNAGCPDMQHTAKSRLYHGAVEALRGEDHARWFVNKILNSLPQAQGNEDFATNVIWELGWGYFQTESSLNCYLELIFKPDYTMLA